ncbi:MAG: hypothetical protein JSV41_08130 [Gemmatimonadota bacterium]|nr:MAG: hypothetical protein JSV41_08130 [Gemmatimonadota bacterium]
MLLVAGMVVGWFARDEIRGFLARVTDRAGEKVELAASPVPSLAQRAEAKIVALGQGEVDEAALTAEELDAWIRYGLKGFFPEYVTDVQADIEDERLVLAGRVATEQVPGIERLGPVAALIGDTASVAVRGRLDGLRPGCGVYYIDIVQVGLVPLPEPVRDQLLAELKRGAEDDLPINAVPFELPGFVIDVGVRGAQVVLRSSLQGRR